MIAETQDAKSIEQLKQFNPIICSNINSDNSTTVCVSGSTVEDIADKSNELLEKGFKNIVLNLEIENKDIRKTIETLTEIRRLAIIGKSELFAYPVMTHITEENPLKSAAIASLLLCRYSNIIVFDIFNEALLTTIFTLRQNIYTDPQKPLQVESKVYE